MQLGGLGVHNVKLRAMAMLIHTFLSQAISSSFPPNQYLLCLYRWHVLEERHFSDPGCPPYYSPAFFSVIKEVKETTPLNVAHVTVKQWYQLLLEKGVTHTSENPDTPPLLIASRAEGNHQMADFPAAYRISIVFGLAPEQKSFMFKLIQNILPTRERLARIGKVQSSLCLYCDGQLDSTAHLLACTRHAEVSTPFLSCLRTYCPDITTEDIVILNIQCSESLELPLAWLVSTCLIIIWEAKSTGKCARLDSCRAELLAKVRLLRSTRWKHYMLHNSALLLEDMINLHFIN